MGEEHGKRLDLGQRMVEQGDEGRRFRPEEGGEARRLGAVQRPERQRHLRPPSVGQLHPIKNDVKSQIETWKTR